jgi:hypothetical protein
MVGLIFRHEGSTILFNWFCCLAWLLVAGWCRNLKTIPSRALQRKGGRVFFFFFEILFFQKSGFVPFAFRCNIYREIFSENLF